MGVIESRGTSSSVLPEQFGKYSLLGHLATGGMAEVWLARQAGSHGFEKIVVIKRARPELTDAETTRQFLEEARLVATLEHPNIAQVYEIGLVNGAYFFVMEYVDGADVRRLIETAIAKRHQVSLADALYIITHVCTALHYAHEKQDLEGQPLNIIHCDVSPSNVLLSRDGAVKVCDFGVAKVHRRGSETPSGVLKGKFSYMSPEQCRGRPIDRRSDVFSIGIVLYELTTLSKLFRASTDYALLQMIADPKIPLPSSRVAGYPRELEYVLLKALAKDPDDRYPTAQALQLDLEQFAREHKLAMSSVGLTNLIRTLFQKREHAVIRPPPSHADHDREVTRRSSESELPALFAAGSLPSRTTPAGPDSATPATVGLRDPDAGSAVGPIAGAPPVRASHARLCLLGAVVAGLSAIAFSIADHVIVSAEDRATAGALAADAERIASLLDAAAQAAHLRADGIATTPMVRAAIETDAATLEDIAASEMVFTAANGEALELYQLRGDQPRSLLRIPRTAGALPPLRGRDTRVHSNGADVTLVASAPISGYRAGLAGVIVIAMPVDLSPVRRALDDHAAAATLTGIGNPLVLAGPRAGAGGGPADASAVEIAVPSRGNGSIASAKLTAVPTRSGGLTWARPVRTLSLGLVALLGATGAISAAQRRHRRRI